ncbi:MAG: nickel-binding protein [Chitinophagaceae bacterium]
MPLFMDMHKASDYSVKPTVEEIKANHIADLAVQDKYGVKFLQYWINEEAGLVFCLMEGPDKESCAAVHQEAHGDMPCNVIELQGGDYMAFMGNEVKVNAADIVERSDGTLDSAYRIILVTDVISVTEPALFDETIEQLIQNTGGRFVRRQGNRTIAAYNEGQPAIECAIGIIGKMKEQFVDAHEVRIGISAGEPVTEQKDLFGDSIKLANRLCDIAQRGQVVISPLAKQLTQSKALHNYKDEEIIKLLSQDDERLLHLLIDSTSSMLSQPGFSIDELGKKLGMSRSQLYRKVTNLTGSPANTFIRELRLQKALQLMQNKYGNITQVAMEVGFSNPSYFAKNFQDRFGVPPLKALKNQS